MNYLSFGHIFLACFLVIQIFIVGVVSFNRKARLTAEKIKCLQSSYRDLFELANDAIFVLDTRQNYIDVNKKAVELFGYSREEFLQLNVRDVIPPDQLKDSDKEFSRLHEKGDYENFIGKQRTKDGRWLDIEVSSSAIVKDGEVIGSRDILRDITERKEQEAEKEALIRDLEKALDEVKTLRGLLPICSACKNIRDEEGVWNRIEKYFSQNFDAEFTHSICPSCMNKLYPEVKDEELATKDY